MDFDTTQRTLCVAHSFLFQGLISNPSSFPDFSDNGLQMTVHKLLCELSAPMYSNKFGEEVGMEVGWLFQCVLSSLPVFWWPY